MRIEKMNLDSHETIMDLLSYKGNLDRSLKLLSNDLFVMERGSRAILQILAENGPSTEYQMGKIGKAFELDRDTVRRRVLGSPTFRGLIAEEFVWLAKRQEFRTGSKKKIYNLTVKGILASLDRVPFERNYAIKQFYSLISAITENEYHIADFTLQYIKFQIGILMSWYKMNGFNLTEAREFSNLFRKNMIEHYLFPQIPNSLVGTKVWQDYDEIGFQFFVLRHIVKTLINKILADTNSTIYSNDYISSLVEKYGVKKTKSVVKEILEKIIFRDWHLHARFPNEISPKNIKPYRLDDQPVIDQKLRWLTIEDDMNLHAKKIFEKLKIHDFERIDVEKLL